MSRSHVPLLLLGFALLGCEENPDPSDCFSFESSVIDFGSAPIGSRVQRVVQVRNLGCRAEGFVLEVLGRSAEAFDVSGQKRIESAAPFEQAVTVPVSFRVLGPGAAEATLRLTPLVVQGAGALIPSIGLRGEGAFQVLELSPARLDFGNVVAGEAASRQVTFQNQLDLEAEVELVPTPGLRLCSQAGAAAFCLRAVDRPLDVDGRFRVPAGESAVFEVVFSPDAAGSTYTAQLDFRTCSSAACLDSMAMTGVGVAAGLRCTPATLEVGPVSPGRTLTASVSCENLLSSPLTVVDWSLTPASDRRLEAEPGRVKVLQPQERLDIEVSFSPIDLADVEGTLRVETDASSPRGRFVEVQLVGLAGGPSIAVLPETGLDFGLVTLIAPARRNLTIVNTGFAPLSISSVVVDIAGTGAFSSPDADATVLQPGEAQTITIQFAPRSEGAVLSAIRLLTNDADSPSVNVPLRGNGVSLAPCQFRIDPSIVDFGAVVRSRSSRRGFEVRNMGADTCLVTALRLNRGSDPAFSLGDEVRSVELAPGASRSFSVAFAPELGGTLSGQLELSISSPTEPFNIIELRGLGVDSETVSVSPASVDFGVQGAGCAARSRTVTILNPSSRPVEIESLLLEAGAPSAFSLTSIPTPLPSQSLLLGPNASATFDVGFASSVMSSFAGAVRVRTRLSGSVLDYYVPLFGETSIDPVQVDDFSATLSDKTDVLFVVDKTGSMSQELEMLAQGFGAFIQYAQNLGIDYQVGVTTTDTNDEAGRLVSGSGMGFDSSSTGPATRRIITPRTMPSPASVFAANMAFQLTGGAPADESGLRAAQLALSSPVVLGHNAGFLRRDANLAIIFMSDEPDQSMGSVGPYLSFFRSIKGASSPNRLSISAISAGNGTCNGAGGAASAAGRYSGLAQQGGGTFGSICASDWANFLTDMGSVVFGARRRYFLSGQPVPSTLRVFVDGLEMPRTAGGNVNFTYESDLNAIAFPSFTVPTAGSRLEVRYTPECL